MSHKAPSERGELLCPAVEYCDPELEGTIVAYGDILGTPEAPKVAYYREAIPITKEVREAWNKGPINPGELFRTAGRCKQCTRHWNSTLKRCDLIDRWPLALPADHKLPPCPIRTQCRGWAQQGPAACRACPNFAGETVHKPLGPLARVTAETRKTYL